MAEMWYYTTEGKQMDPVAIKELKRLVGEGVLKPTDMVWKEGMPRWIRASSLKELFPDPIAALDQYFTSTKGPERRQDPLTTEVAAPADKTSMAASESATSRKERAPMADEEPQQKKKRRASESDEEDSGRPPRRRAEPKSGGSSLLIFIFLIFGAFVLLGGLGGGVVLLIVLTRPGDQKPVPPPPIVDGPKKDGIPLDGKPKEPPLPEGVKTGRGTFDTKLIKPGKSEEHRFQARAGFAASINVTALQATPNTQIHIIVTKDADPNFRITADIGPNANPSVNFNLPNTEIVRVSIHNATPKGSARCTVIFNVSP
jgi:GYF domain 2